MLYLIKLGELTLKKGTRPFFEKTLRKNIQARLPGTVKMRNGRFYLETEAPETVCQERLRTLPGIAGFARAYPCDKRDGEQLKALCLQLAEQCVSKWSETSSFRLSVRRIDKSLPQTSEKYASWLGGAVLQKYPDLRVELKNPDWRIHVELRERAYLYHSETPGPGGLPSGSTGRSMLMLSGGIDSPVAGYLIGKRGMHLEAVYFDTPPFTTEEAYDKTRRLAAQLARWTGPVRLHRVPFTGLQLALRKHTRSKHLVIQSRACMITLSERLARRQQCQALISGESLGQVASQTIENLQYTNLFSRLPILRPLIGQSKEDIIAVSRRIGCFSISTEPAIDCCSYFAPEFPTIKAPLSECEAELEQLPELETLLEQTLRDTTDEYIVPNWEFGIPAAD